MAVVNPQDSVNKVKVCNICGDDGFDNCLAKCSQCNGAEHTYCMRTIFDVVPTDWVCEGCTSKQKATVSKERYVQQESQFSQAFKKRILSRVLSDPLPSSVCKDAGLLRGSSLKRSSAECKADQFVAMGMAEGLPRSEVQLKVSTTFKETLPANTNQHLNSNAYCVATAKAVSTSKDDLEERSRRDVPLASMKTVGNLSNLQSVVKPGVVATNVKNLQCKVEPAAMVKGTSSIAQGEKSKMMGLKSSYNPSAVKPLPAEQEQQELGKTAGVTSSVKEKSSQRVNFQRDSANDVGSAGTGTACKTPSIIADSVIAIVGLESVSNNMGILAEASISTPESTRFNHVTTGHQKNAGEKKRLIIRDFPIISEKINVTDEPSVYTSSNQKEKFAGEVGCPSGAEGLSVLDVGKETGTGQMPEEVLEGIDGSTMASENGQLTRQETKGMVEPSMPSGMVCEIEQQQLTREESAVKENAVRSTEDSCTILKLKAEVNGHGGLTQLRSVGAKAQDKNVMQEGGTAQSPFSMIEIPMSADLPAEASLDKIATTYSALVLEQNVESADLSTCSRAKESFHVSVPGQELEVHKRTSNAGINRIARALLKRITRRDFPIAKSHSTKLGKSAVSTCKKATNIARQEVTSLQDDRQVNKSSFLTQVKKVTKRDFPIVPSNVPASLYPAHCTSSTSMKSLEMPSTQLLPVERTSVMGPALGKDIKTAGRISQAKEKDCQSSKVERRSADKRTDCDKQQECDAAILVSCVLEEAPRNDASTVTKVGTVSVVTTTTELHSNRKALEKSGDSSSSLNYELPDEAAAPCEITGGCSDRPEPRAGGSLEDESVVRAVKKLVSERLLLTNAKVSSGHANSLSNGEVCVGVHHHLLKQKGRGSEAVSGKTTIKAHSNKEAFAGKSTRLGQADQNVFSSHVNLSPYKCASGVRSSANRSLPRAAGDDRPVNCRSEDKDSSWKKVRFSVNEEHDLNRDKRQSLSSIRKDLKKDIFYTRHRNESCEQFDHMEKPSSFRSKHASLTGSNFDFRAIKRDHRSEDSRCGAGYSPEFSKAKIKNNQREWKENDSQAFLERGSAERSLDIEHMKRPFLDPAFYKGAYRCARCNEVGHSIEFCRVKGMDKRRDWGRRDSLDPNDKQRAWRKKDSPDYYDMQREWRKKDPPDLIHKQKEWRNKESPDLHEKWRDWEMEDTFQKERDWERKDSSNFIEKQRRQWRGNDSLDFCDVDSPEKRSDTRHPKRSFPGFQGSYERERWRYDASKENASNSRSCPEPNHADSIQVCSKRPIQVYECSQFDKERAIQWQSREQAGIESESLGPEHPSKAKKIRTQPLLEQPEYARVHPRQMVRVQATIRPSQSRPTRNNFVQERKAFPSSQVLWTGCFNVTSKNRWSTFYKGIQAHPSTVADPKVCKAMLALPFELQLDEIKRGEETNSWPRAFQQCPPTSHCIGIFFAPKDMESDDAWFQPLVHRLNAGGLVLKSEMDVMQLLIFPSQLLPEAEQCWDGRFFLWGIFRRNKSRIMEDLQPPSERDHGIDFESPEGNGEVIDMDIDMVGGRDAVLQERQDFSPPLPPPLPPGFLPPPPPLP